MKRKSVFLLLAVVFICWAPVQKPVTVYLIGDSTMINKTPEIYPATGWGQMLGHFFTDQVIIANNARDDASTKTFINEKNWEAVFNKLQRGDYVFIQFGHNDEKVFIPALGISPEGYRANLVKFITETRSRGAIPVLLTPVMRRSFVNGILTDTHREYAPVVRKVAAEYRVALVDLHKRTEDLLKQYGETGSVKFFLWAKPGEYKNRPDGIKDDMNLNATGAAEVARLAAEEIKKSDLPLKQFLK